MCDVESIKDLLEYVEKYFLKSGTKYTIDKQYEYIYNSIVLYAKQHKLIRSTLLLLENDMNEEAIILARSILNNYFLIGYLLNDKDEKRLEKFKLQPLLSYKLHLKNLKKISERDFFNQLQSEERRLLFNKIDVEQELEKVQISIQEYKKDISGLELFKIPNLADSARKEGIELYSAYYNTASKYEHSDISTLVCYKDDCDDNEQSFKLVLNRTDEELKKMIFSIIVISYFCSIDQIYSKIAETNCNLINIYDQDQLNIIKDKLERIAKCYS